MFNALSFKGYGKLQGTLLGSLGGVVTGETTSEDLGIAVPVLQETLVR